MINDKDGDLVFILKEADANVFCSLCRGPARRVFVFILHGLDMNEPTELPISTCENCALGIHDRLTEGLYGSL